VPVGNVRFKSIETLECVSAGREIYFTCVSTNIPKGEPAMIIGNFRYDAVHDTYSGDITTLTLQHSDVVLRPNGKSSEKEPDYRIMQERKDGTVEFGAAWKRTGEHGREFLSIMLDDPALPSPLNAVMFVADNGESTRLVWQRPPKNTPAAEAKASATRVRRPQIVRSPQPA
jgi:uncharacterized protein (DUF736 family)